VTIPDYPVTSVLLGQGYVGRGDWGWNGVSQEQEENNAGNVRGKGRGRGVMMRIYMQ
jgi:hypothetical protein